MKTRQKPTPTRADHVCPDRHCGQQSAAVIYRHMACDTLPCASLTFITYVNFGFVLSR